MSNRSCVAFIAAVLLSACAAPAPLSDGRQRAATEPAPRAPVVRPAPPAPSIPPPPPTTPPPVETKPLPAAPPIVAEPSAPTAAPSVIVPTPSGRFVAGKGPIALVLPLNSPTYARAADAVRAGFVAAAESAGVRYTIVGHGDGEALAAMVKARDAGARLIVGPLLRDDLRAVATAGVDLPPTIALNALDDGTPLPAPVYTLALTIEADALQLARRARQDGAQTLAVVGGESGLQKRFASAFVDEWLRLGGGPPTTMRFDRAPDMLALLRRELGRTHVDAVVLALDAPDAAMVKPYVPPGIATYTSSQVNDRQPREVLRDLDDVRFVDIPWLVDADSPSYAKLPRLEYPNAALDRLYALGLDALAVAQAFEDGPPSKLDLDGATGHLWLDGSRQIQREGVLVQFRAGVIVPADVR